MIIGERNLILGKYIVYISDYSISIFRYMKDKFIYYIDKVRNIKTSVIPMSNSPPVKIGFYNTI